MRMYDVIAKKRDGFELSEEEIAYVIQGYVNGVFWERNTLSEQSAKSKGGL